MNHRTEKALLTLQGEVDRDGSHGIEKIYAACVQCGVEPEDLEPGFGDSGPAVHEKVPKERAPELLKHRKGIRDGLREQRVQQVAVALQGMAEDDMRRLTKCGGRSLASGVRPVTDTDLPPAEELDGMAEVQAAQERQMENVRRQQARKATAICTDFLMGKKRAEDADAQIKALDDRLKDARKEQDLKYKAKRVEAQKGTEKRQQGAAKAAQERDNYEDEVERKAAERLAAARAKRAQTYSTENLRAKLEKSSAKRETAFQQAVELEERTLATIEAHQDATSQRLHERSVWVAEQMEQRRQDGHARFVQKQVAVHAMNLDWAEKKLKFHADFTKHFDEARGRHRDELKTRSKSLGDVTKKSIEKWRATYDRIGNEKNGRDKELMERLHAANDKVENVLKPMKLKCGGDVFSHLEVKDKTFGDLVGRRRRELQKAQDAKTQSLLIKLAERNRKDEATADGERQVQRRRTEAAKETLRYSNEATAVFQRIQSEPNEARIRQAMSGLGFKMPRLDGRDDDEEGS